MKAEVVDLEGRLRRQPAAVSDFWFAQMDVRLGRIEGMVARIQQQVWLAVAIAAALLAVEMLRLWAGN